MPSSVLRAPHIHSSFVACVFLLALPLLSPAETIERSKDGVALRSSSGTLQVTVCSERVIHVVASPTIEIPKSIVPTVIRPCEGAPFTISSSASTVSIKTSALRVEIDRSTNSVRFLSDAGTPVLSEQPHGGRSITPVDLRRHAHLRDSPGLSSCPPMKRFTVWVNIRKGFSTCATYRSACCRRIQISRSHFSFRRMAMACFGITRR